MEGVGSPPGQNTGSFLPHLLISICGITATALAILAYHLIVKYITRRRRQQRSTLSASQTLPFSKGIEEKVLLTIPILAYSSKDCKLFRVDQIECVICLGDLEDGEMVRLLPNCRHAFHVPCIGNWFLGHSTCPFCRSPVVAEPKSSFGNSDLPTTIVDDDVRNEERLQRSASSSGVEYLHMAIEEKKQLLAATLKRSLSMGECSNYVIVIVQNDDDDDDDDDEMCKQEGDDHQSGSSSSTRILRESKSFTARSMKQLDRMSSRVVRSFSQLRISSRSSSNTTANGILPY